MKFMELDEDGNIHHIMDDPTITMLPVVNRFHHRGPDGKPHRNEAGHPVAYNGRRVLGVEPTEHLPHLFPRAISNEHYKRIMDSGGLAGYTDPKNRKGAWRFKWDEARKEPAKLFLDPFEVPARPESLPQKPCTDCSDKKAQI